MRLFREATLSGLVKAQKSLLLASAFGSAVVVSDTSGNVKLAKRTEGGRRLRARDDMVASTLLAVAHGQRIRGEVSSGVYLGVA